MKIETSPAWAAIWFSKNSKDGVRRHIIYREGLPALFRTRRKTREFISKHYGYIRTRKDLRSEPHGWRVPKAARVGVIEI